MGSLLSVAPAFAMGKNPMKKTTPQPQRSLLEQQAEARQRLVGWLSDERNDLPGWPIDEKMKETPGLRKKLTTIAGSEGEPYRRLDAAVALAFFGWDAPEAVWVFELVLARKGKGFAVTNSLMEVGTACLGLAVLGHTEKIAEIQEAAKSPVNFKDNIEAALRLMELKRTQ